MLKIAPNENNISTALFASGDYDGGIMQSSVLLGFPNSVLKMNIF